MVTIVKQNRKPLGVYIPVPDRIMWRNDFINGMTVPNARNPEKRIDITQAYNNNDSSCCYSLNDISDPSEGEDYRRNLQWQIAIGANIITTDDPNSIEVYADKERKLNRILTQKVTNPPEELRSTLSWELGYAPKPYESFNIKAWDGAYSSDWAGEACLYDNRFGSHYAWMYGCTDVRQ